MTDRPYNVLFLCTGNSARSIIAESLLNSLGEGRFNAHSAGSYPSGVVNPLVLEFLRAKGLPTDRARSKSWDEFATPDATQMDLVVTVCDQAAGEACPLWPGQPARAHWSAPDPAAFMNDPKAARKVIHDVFDLMHRRISRLVKLPVEQLDSRSLQKETRRIADDTGSSNHPRDS